MPGQLELIGIGLLNTFSPLNASMIILGLTIGVLAGGNEGAIADCSAVGGIVIASSSGDGLVGINRGTVTDCSVDVVVTGSTAGR